MLSKNFYRSFTAAFFLILFSNPAFSYSCANSSNVAEEFICDYPSIKALDRQLNRTYSRAKRRVARSKSKRRKLLRSQRAWLRKRNRKFNHPSCGVSCAKRFYRVRIKQLNRYR